MPPQPRNWPSTLPYLEAPLLDPALDAGQLAFLRTKPASPSSSSSSSSSPLLPPVPAAATVSPSPLVRIQPIRDPAHPADAQHGLFAARDLRPGTFILPYLGRVHPPSTADPASDYDLWLDRGAGLAVDAARRGNEARFVNDFRGVRDGPNAELGAAWCERWGQVCAGFWVLGPGRVRAKGREGQRGQKATRKMWEGIKKGDEILVSYGKGFWDGRRGAEGEEVEEEEEEEEKVLPSEV